MTSTLGCANGETSEPNDGSGNLGGYAGAAGFPGGGAPQGGFPGGGAPQGGFPQGGFPQGGGSQAGAPQGGAPQGGFPGGGAPQGGVPQGGFPQGGGGFVSDTGGAPQGGFNAGTGGEGQGGVPVGTGGATTASPPQCLSSANEAAIIGDSYVTGAASPDLYTALGQVNSFTSGFRRYAVPGTSMASGGLTGLIPPQWDQAAAAGTTKFLIMDGGGNDILICDVGKYPNCNNDCKSPGSSTKTTCKTIVSEAVAAAEALMQKAATQGLQNVVYFFYPHLPGVNAGYKEITDYAQPFAKASCDGAFQKSGGKLNCYFVDLVQPFAAVGGDANPLNFVSDSIHPSAQGQQIIAKELNNVMQQHCVGEQSGCCTP